jgi:predicted nucleotidyltransferase
MSSINPKENNIPQSIIEKAWDVLDGWGPSEKTSERTTLLAEQPQQRKRIDTARLKGIIDYTAFKCSPISSIARDEATEQSDIDGGIVVTETTVPIQQQLAFIDDLREQGFRVYHSEEVAYASAQVQFDELLKMFGSWDDLTSSVSEDAKTIQMILGMSSEVINFLTKGELEKNIYENVKISEHEAIYLVGHVIE